VSPITSDAIDVFRLRSLWQPAPPALQLASADVHVWRARIDEAGFDLSRLEPLLSSDERARAERFAFADLRRRFIVTRGILRWLLAGYLEEDPRRLRFRYGPHGKPALDARRGEQTLQFSLSHSHGLALYAITRGREVGIDVERIRDDVACDDLAVAVTRRPLALASALAKVWQQAAGPAPAIAQPLAGPGDSVDGRIQRLLAAPEPPPSRTPSLAPVLGMGASALGALLVLEAAQVVALFATMGCGGLLRALLL